MLYCVLLLLSSAQFTAQFPISVEATKEISATHGYFFFIKCGLYYLSNTPENISISLVEIPNRVANSRHPFIASITSEIIFSAVFRLSI